MSNKPGQAADAHTAGSEPTQKQAQSAIADPLLGARGVIDMDNVETIQSVRALLSVARLTGRIHELGHRLDEIDLAAQRIRTALVSLSTVKAVVDDAKIILRTGSAFSDAASYPALAATFNEFCNQMNLLVEESSVDAVNLLTGTDLTVKFNEDGSHDFTIKGSDITADGLGISRLVEETAGEAEFLVKIRELINAAQQLTTQQTLLEGALTIINSRRSFTKKTVHTLDESVRQITEDKTSRASFYQTVSGLLGASVRHQLEASIARSCADYVSDYRPAYGPGHKTAADPNAIAESMTDSPASLDDASSTADVPPAFAESDTPPTAPFAGGDTTEFNIMMTCLSEAVETEAIETEAIETGAIETEAIETGAIETEAIETEAIETEAIETEAIETGANENSESVSAEVAIALETKRATESITPVDAPIGPLDLALASLDTMYSLIEDDPTPTGNDTLPDKMPDSIFATKKQDVTGGLDVPVDPTPERPQSNATGIRAILNRLRHSEPVEPRIEPILEIGGVQPAPSDWDLTDESNGPGTDSEQSDQNIAQDCSDEEATFEHGACQLASATLDALSADLLRQIDAGVHAAAELEYDKGDLAVYARLLGEIASERSDDLHDIYLDDEIFRADARQFKHFFLHLIKAHIDNDGDSNSDALIRSWLNSPYGCVYKGLYRHCPPETQDKPTLSSS